MMDINDKYLQWFTKFLIKSRVEVVLRLNQIISLQMNFLNSSLKHSIEEEFIHPLETIFGVLFN